MNRIFIAALVLLLMTGSGMACSATINYSNNLISIYGTNKEVNNSCINSTLDNSSQFVSDGNGGWIQKIPMKINSTTVTYFINSSDTVKILHEANFTNQGISQYNNTIIQVNGTLSNHVTGAYTFDVASNVYLNNITFRLGTQNGNSWVYLKSIAGWINDSTITSYNNSTGFAVLSTDAKGDGTIRPVFKLFNAHNLSFNRNTIQYLDYGGLFIASSYNIYGHDNNINENYCGYYITNSHDIVSSNDTVFNGSWAGFEIGSASYNISINSSVNMSDRGYNIHDTGTRNISISGNITNTTLATDRYSTGVWMYNNVSNINISNTNLFKQGSTGIGGLRNISNITLNNIYIEFTDVNWKFNNTKTEDVSNPEIGIGFFMSYKKWKTNSLEAYGDNLSSFSGWESNNILLSNITYNNTQVFLYTEGINNISFDSLPPNVLYSYGFPRMVNTTNIYFNGSWQGNSTAILLPGNRTIGLGSREVSEQMERGYIHSYGANTGTDQFFNYIFSANNLWVLPQNYMRRTNGSIEEWGNTPLDFYLYSPPFALFYGSNKTNNIFSNGTNYIHLYNDTLEPDGYHTINASILPSSDSIVVNVTTWNSTHVSFNDTSDNVTNTAEYRIGDRTPSTKYRIVIQNGSSTNTNATSFYMLANSTGYLNYNSTGYDSGRWTTVSPEPASSVPVIVTTVFVTVIIGGVTYILRRLKKI